MLFILITEFLDLLSPFEQGKESTLPCESGGGRGGAWTRCRKD